LSSSSSRKPGACYIYGSVHSRIPPRGVLEGVVGRVDYVLLEGVDFSGFWRLVLRRPDLALGLLLLQAFLGLTWLGARVEGWRRGVEFAGDMAYVRDFFASRDPRVRVEFVDASLEELVATHRREFIVMSASSAAFLVAAAYATCYTLLTRDARGLLATPALFSSLIFLYALAKLISARDQRLVDRVVELVRRGYSVLVVRGRGHVAYDREELRKRGVDCEVLDLR